MPIKVTCETCGAAFQTKDSSAGKTAKCPKCGSPIRIPYPDDGDDIFDAEEVQDDDGGFDFGDYDPSAGQTVEREDRKPCPACGEMIMRKAAKCRYCGEIFDPALKKLETKKKRGVHADIDEDMTTGDWVVAILCSGIGCIAGIVWMIQGKPKGGKMVGVSLLFFFLWGAIRVVLENLANQ